MRTERREMLQRRPPVAVEDLDLNRRALALMRDVATETGIARALDAAGHRERRHEWTRTAGKRGIQSAAEELVVLAGAGAHRRELTSYVVFLQEVVDELAGPEGLDDRTALERENIESDAAEDHTHAAALLDPPSPLELDLRLTLLRREIVAKQALARHLEHARRRHLLGLHDRRIA